MPPTSHVANARIVIVKFVSSLLLAFVLTSRWGMPGFIASYAITDLLSLAYAYHQARIRYEVKFVERGLFNIYSSSIVSAGIALFIRAIIPTISSLMDLVPTGSIFIFCYLILSPIFGAIERQDITNLSSMFGGGHLGMIVARVLNLYQRGASALKLFK